MPDPDGGARNYWDLHARHDPLWAILSDPEKTGRRWDLPSFLETGQREVSLLMFQLRALGLEPDPAAALDFGCGIGRLTQPLADHFDLVVGTDISPEMIRLADGINGSPESGSLRDRRRRQSRHALHGRVHVHVFERGAPSTSSRSPP